MKRASIIGLVVCLSLLLGACLRPATGLPPQPTQDQSAVYTQAVKTVEAGLTATAGPQATVETAAPEATATLPPAVTATSTVLEATSAPSQTPAATTTVTAQLPTPSLSAADPRASLGNPDFRDTFADGKNWAFGPDAHSSMEVKDGKVVMKAFTPDYFNSWTLAWPKLTDFYLELTGTFGTCAGLDRFGLVVRAPDPTQGYLVGLSCDGKYALWIWDGKQEIDLINWTASPAILKGASQANRLGIKAQGDHLSIYINGTLVGDIHDKSYSQGYFGLFIGAVQTANFTAQVSEVDYWELK